MVQPKTVMAGCSSQRRGFTLIELLVVIAVIGVLAGAAMVALSPARSQAQDARRLSDMKQLVNALELYHNRNGQYPLAGGEAESLCDGWDTSSVDGDGDGTLFLDALKEDGVMPDTPVDPNNTGSCASGLLYRYQRYAAGANGCNPGRGAYYVFGVNVMEAEEGQHPESPGWSCAEKDWQEEFDWVTGAFES